MIPCRGEEAAMGRAITIRTDLGTAADLRRMAKQQRGRRPVLRLLAIANAIEGMSRAQAARAVGIERQSLCDAIKRSTLKGSLGWWIGPKATDASSSARPSRRCSST